MSQTDTEQDIGEYLATAKPRKWYKKRWVWAVAAIARQNTMLAAAARASDINGDESDGVAIIDLAKRSVTTRCVAPAGAPSAAAEAHEPASTPGAHAPP